MISYQLAQTEEELSQILSLQKTNHFKVVTNPEEKIKEGFVSAEHDMDLLKRFNDPYPHVIAKFNHEVVGYTLVMERKHADTIPLLSPMFSQINQTNYNGTALKDTAYVVMGQVCIAHDFRGQGIFRGLYLRLKEHLKNDFQYLITEISTENPRSIHAHLSVGFKVIKEYVEDGFDWVLVLWEIGTDADSN